MAGGDRRVADTMTANELRERVFALSAGLSGRSEQLWGIWYGNAADFLCGFLALALAGKHIVLPQNIQPGNEAKLSRQFDALLIDNMDSELHLPQFTPDSLVMPNRLSRSFDEWANYDTPVSLTLYTSGSTGEPSAVHKTLASLEKEVTLLQQCFGETLGVSPVLSTVSHQHIYGLLHYVLWPFMRGAPFDGVRHQYPESLADAMGQEEAVVLVSSPTHLSRLPGAPVFAARADRLVDIISSGGPLAKEDALALTSLCGRAPLEVLGSTETGGVATRRRHQTDHWQSLPGVQLSLSDKGCLMVQGEHMSLVEPFEMGDRAHILDRGRFELLGRADRVVKVEGKRLSLTEMEACLSDHPDVIEARLLVITGRREEVAAVVCLSAPGQERLEQGAKRHINRSLRTHLSACFEAPLLPRRWRYVAALPYNAQGKVPLAALRKLFDPEPD